MSAKETIDARPETIGTLITFSSNPYTILVPIYQRFYQWDKSKVIDLLRLTDPDSRDFGFIGTMVFVRAKNECLEVVDGQQRLISIVIILCALRDYIKEYVGQCNDPEVQAMLKDLCNDLQKENLIVSRSYSDAEDHPRLLFYRKSYGIFKERYLLGNHDYIPDEIISRTETNNFLYNYEEAKKYLHDKYDHHKVAEITPLLYKRVERLKGLVVNAIYIAKHEYAGEVFESINGTGITLKLSELVKNYVFRSVASSSNVQTKWEEIERNCDNKIDLVENVIKYDWSNRHDETQDFEIFRSIKENVSNVDEYLNRLLRVSKIFHFYLHPSTENFGSLKLTDNRNDKNHIIRSSTVLRIINVKQFLRLVIALDSLREYINISDYCRLIKLIHDFQVRAKISSIATHEIDRLYSRYGRKLQRLHDSLTESRASTKEVQSAVRSIILVDLQKDMAKISSDESFFTGVHNYSRTKSTGKDFFKYLLSCIENSYQRNELIIDTRDNQITLEEIYPQDPSSNWHDSDLTVEDIYKLSNATILKGKDNGAGSNKYIDQKLPIYSKSTLELNKKLVALIDGHNNRWDRSTMSLRAKEISEAASKIWSLKS